MISISPSGITSSSCSPAAAPVSSACSIAAANAPTGRADTIMHAASAALRNRVLFFLIVYPSLSLLSGYLPRRRGTSSLLYPPPPYLAAIVSDFFAPPKFFAIFRHNAQPYRFAPPLTSTCTKQRREVWRPIRQNFQTKYLKFVLSVVLSL